MLNPLALAENPMLGFRSRVWQATIMSLFVTVVAVTQLPATSFVTQTFDELPFQPIDGLTFKDATFDFKINGIDSLDAHYGSFGPVATEHVSDPSLVGNSAGILSVEFALATPVIEFGLALSDNGPVTDALRVTFYDHVNAVILSESVSAAASQESLGFSDLFYRYTGTAVRRMELDFADAPGSFALDNLTYQIPEPAMLLTFLMSGVVVTLHHRRTRNKL